MISRRVKLNLTRQQESQLNEWLWILTGVHNWAVRKIKLDAGDGIYYSKFSFQNLLARHSKKIGIPSHVLGAVLRNVHFSWIQFTKKTLKEPRLKGSRNKLNSIPFPDALPDLHSNRIDLPGLRNVRYHKQKMPSGKIKCSRIIKRPSGWYLLITIDCEPNSIPITGNGSIGIDPGFKSLLTLSNGTKIEHPRELEAGVRRLAQAQRGKNKKLTARLHERMANRRKDRNHKLSRTLVSENGLIVFSKDNHGAIARKFGKSVASSGHGQLRQMLSYKSSSCGRRYVEVNPRFSTMTCSSCQFRTGPTGLRGLAVRQWKCPCGAEHDRDINAAINTLNAGAGFALERSGNAISEIAAVCEDQLTMKDE